MKAITITTPKLNDVLNTSNKTDFSAAADMTNCQWHELDIAAETYRSAGLEGCRFEAIQATGALFQSCQFLDCELIGGDMTAVHADSNGFERVLFGKVRAGGIDLAAASLKHVDFSGCKLTMANFRQAELRNVVFRDCDLSKADFRGALLTNVAFISCTMEATEMQGVKCSNVDLRRSTLTGLVGVASLKGATLSTVQLMGLAPDLAMELEILIED